MSQTESMLSAACAILVVTAGAAAQAAIGMGLNLFAIPLLVLIDPAFAPGPVLAASLLLSGLAIWRVPVEVDRGELVPTIGGLVAGTLVAALILASIDTRHLSRLLGVLVVAAVVLVLSGVSARITRATLAVAGVASGVMGTIAGVHAPPVALLYQSQSPARIRGALLTLIGLGNALSLLALAAVGRFERQELAATAILLPGVALGLLLAPLVVRWLSARHIRAAILAISAVSGLTLVWKG